MFTRLYICYIDAEGNARKAFVLLQKDPDFYASFLKTYNVPELVDGPLRFSHHDLVRAARFERAIEVPNPIITGATPKAADSPAYDEGYTRE